VFDERIDACTAMEVLSLIKNSLQQTTNDGAATPPSSSNPITKHFRLIRQTSSAGQEMVWKIYDAVRLVDGKVSKLLEGGVKERCWSVAWSVARQKRLTIILSQTAEPFHTVVIKIHHAIADRRI